MKLSSQNFRDGERIPTEFAFGKRANGEPPFALSENRSPQLAWSEAPADTKSFVLLCIDTEAPTKIDGVNQPGRRVSALLPRTEFVHWVMVDIPAECSELNIGTCSNGIVAHGKKNPPGPPGAKQGLNDYTDWFTDDTTMAGDYYGYDGPCPPWNDELLHYYHFYIYALDVATLGLSGRFTAAEVRRAMDTHVLAQAQLTGAYAIAHVVG